MKETLKARELEVSALEEEVNKAHGDIQNRDATMKVTSIVQLPCDPLGLYALTLTLALPPTALVVQFCAAM